MVDPNVIDSECSEALDKGAVTCQTSFLTNRERDRQRLLSVDYVAISALLPYKGNARTHSKAQIGKIAESIRAFGFTNPILIDVNRTIIAGHGQVEAAKLLKMQQVPTIRLESLTPAEVRAYAIADNRLAEDAGWDRQILKIELESLIVEDQIDISVTGFEVAEIDLVLNDKPIGDDPADCLPTEIQAVVSQPGDLWLLGPHRVLCGDARDGSCFSMLMRDRRAAVVFADPPYNVPIDGHAGGLGKTYHPDFAMAAGEMSREDFTEFLFSAFTQLAAWSTDGSVHFICMDWRHIQEITSAGLRVYKKMLNLCTWVKDVGGMGSFYRSQHELIFVFRNGKTMHRNNVQLGRFGRYRTNVWQYRSANSSSRTGEDGDMLKLHATPKPVSLVADALLDCSARGDIVLDSFLGSGTTLLAAERTGRVCRAIEIEPRFADLAVRRWQQHTGQAAVHALTGREFSSVLPQEALHGK